MFVVIVALAAGILIGLIKSIPPRANRYAGKLSHAGIVILLFAMGVSIGSNPEILAGLRYTGIRAALIALTATAGSVLLARIMETVIKR